MAAFTLWVTALLLLLDSNVSAFLFSSQSATGCDTIFSDFKGGLLNDGTAIAKPVFFRNHPVLVQEIAINIVDCPEYAALLLGNFSVMYMDAADAVLKGQFKELASNPSVIMTSNFVIPHYDLRIQFGGTPRLSRSLKIVSSIVGTCTPDIVVTGCEPTASLCKLGCLNGGECVEIDTCDCPAGYVGDRCESIFTIPDVYNISLGGMNGTTVSFDGDFQFELFDKIEFVDVASSRRNARGISRRHGHDHHHGSFHVHDHGGYTHCSHHGHDCNQIFGHGHHAAFTTQCQINYGHDHHGHTHLYATNRPDHHNHGNTHHGHHHQQPQLGASLVHTPQQLTMTVNNGHAYCHLNVHHHMGPGQHHDIVSSFSPYHGCSLYIDGHHVGSQAPSPAPTSTFTPLPPQPFCMGRCNNGVNNNVTYNVNLSNLMFTGGSLQNMVTNGIAPLLGGVLGSLFQTQAPKRVTTTTPVTTAIHTTPTPAVTLNHHTTLTVTTPSTTTTTTTLVMTTKGLSSPPICYDCGAMPTDGQCQHLKMCLSGEICVVYDDHGNYTHRCLDRNTCFTAKKSVGVNGCWECCTGYLCNEKCPPAPCNDEPLCATIKSSGIDVCADATFALKNCKKSCNLCPIAGRR